MGVRITPGWLDRRVLFLRRGVGDRGPGTGETVILSTSGFREPCAKHRNLSAAHLPCKLGCAQPGSQDRIPQWCL